jgi:glutamine cyclotransferase
MLLNEVEYVRSRRAGEKNHIWANIFMQNEIVKIDEETGVISQTINLKNLNDIH